MSNDRFQNKYRIPSTRLQNWDYGWCGMYFVTICTARREHSFGEIENGTMHLSPVGVIADVLWHELKNHFDNIELDAFVVMPNHIHGIVAINNNGDNDETTTTNTVDGIRTVETTHALSLQPQPQSAKTIGQQRFQHQGSKTLSSIIGAYKSAVSRHSHRLGYDFAWQSRFYDNIIRNNDALNRIQDYIHNNPNNWNEDKFYQL